MVARVACNSQKTKVVNTEWVERKEVRALGFIGQLGNQNFKKSY